MNTSARKAIFLDVNVTSTYKLLDITVRPAFRVGSSNSYSFSGADFWLFVKNWGIWNQVYNSAKGSGDKINTDANWFATIFVLPPNNGDEYLVAFKWSGSLSIWYTGIWDHTINWFNMFSWTVADMLPSNFVIKYYDWQYTWNYLKMWDVEANSSGNYDLIKDSDFSMMTYNLTTILNPSHPLCFDLDLNKMINALEQTIVIESYNSFWFISLQDEIVLSDFIDL